MDLNVSYLGDQFVKNVTNWYVDSNSITVLNMPFEGQHNSTHTKDYSGNSNDGVVYGSTLSSSGYDGGRAYSFNGTNDYIQSEDVVPITGDSDRTISFWAYPLTSDQSSMVGWGSNVNDQRFHAGIYSGDWHLWGFGFGNDWDTGVSVQTGEWSHHAITYDGSTARWFVNGSELGSGFSHTFNTASSQLDIGRKVDTGFTYYFEGMIDDVVIYNRTLSEEQIQALAEKRTDYIAYQETATSEVWQACVSPTDGISEGAETCSNSLTILDVDPVLEYVMLNTTSIYNVTIDDLLLHYYVSGVGALPLKNITNWYRNATSITALNMPFESDTSYEDYSGYGNDGTVVGPTWAATGGHDEWGAYDF